MMPRSDSTFPLSLCGPALLLWASLLLSAAVAAETLPQAIRQTLAQHPDIRSGEALLNVTAERLQQARSNYYPTLGLDGAASDAKDRDAGLPEDRTTRRADVFLRWNLFRGLGDRQGERTAEFDQSAADADLEAAREQVALQVVQTYLEVLRLRRLLALSDEFIGEQQKLGDDVRKRVHAGRLALADHEQMRASLIQAKLQQTQWRGSLRGAEARYRLLVGVAPGELSEPVMDDVAASLELDELMQQALAGNRRVHGALQRAAARGEEVGIASAALYPSFDLELRKRLYSEIVPTPQTETRHSAQISFNYQMPLGGSSFSRQREAVQRKLAALAAADTELLQARSEIAQGWSTWREARDMAPQLAERVEASDKVVKAYDLQFEAARRSINDLLAVRSERYRARVDLLENRMGQLASSAQMLALLGRLRESVLSAAARSGG